jgi:hypothetical protein
MASGAAAQTRAGTFSCKATAAKVLQAPLVVANPQDDPCANDSRSLLAPSILSTTIGALHSQTAIHAGALPANGDHNIATASAAGVLTTLIPGHTIKADAVGSEVQEGCAGPHNGPLHLHVWPPTSSVVNLTIDGNSTPVGNAPLTIPVGGLATVYANRTVTSSSSVDQIALEVDLLGVPVLTLADSQIDVSGDPCGTV